MTLPPRANPHLAGLRAVEDTLREWIEGNRLPHALILGGESGIGKATLAYRLAKFLLAPPSARHDSGLGSDGDTPSTRRIVAGSHGDLLTVERHRDVDNGKPSKDIAVEDVRRIAGFLRLSASEGGWRVAIVDEAAHLNRAGQNALLKILEEPPEKSLLMLVCDRPGLLLPTIHSRCRHVRMQPLAEADIEALLADALPETGAEGRRDLAALSEGSIGRALQIAEHDGLSLYHEVTSLVETGRRDWPKIHAFAERLASPAADASYHLFCEIAPSLPLRHLRREAADGGSGLDRWIAACDKVSATLASAETANLDRKLAIWSVFETLAEAAAPWD